MDRFKTVCIMDEYEPIKDKTSQSYLNSIIQKTGWWNDVGEDLDNYYYICNKGNCHDVLVYYYQKEEHKKDHHTDTCCVIL